MHPFILHYNQVVVPRLREVQSYISSYQVPRVTKVVLNCGFGDIITTGKPVEEVEKLLAAISGQKPMLAKAKKAIAGFKIRQGLEVGMKVTLRGTRMYDFLSKFMQIALPRSRDFRGVKPSGISADGNLNIGIRDSQIFPEISHEHINHSLQVTVVSTARTQAEARLLYESLGFVFQTGSDIIERPKGKKSIRRK